MRDFETVKFVMWAFIGLIVLFSGVFETPIAALNYCVCWINLMIEIILVIKNGD